MEVAMKKHYDIGLVGCWYWGNYGSILNGYATHQILKKLGLSTLNIVTPNNGFEPHAKKFFSAAYKEEDISPVLSFDELDEFNKRCDTFLTGSDQIWNYKTGKTDIRYDKYFRLDFVEDKKRKISFATSFGNYIPESEEHHKIFQKLLERYNAISVREEEGVDILKKAYGLEADQVMEPVLCLEPEYWNNIAQFSKYKEREQYLLTYILDPTPEKRKAIEFYSNKLGLKTINILDGFSGTYKKNREKLNLPNILPNIWCADFLNYFSNAYYVITDSFHGVCFSVLYNKPFIAIGNRSRGIKRFETLLTKFDIKDRLVSDIKIPLDEKYLYHLDYKKTNLVIERERERSIKWLKEAIKIPVNQKVKKVKKHVNVTLEQEKCMGCGACVSECPVDAVKLAEDDLGIYRAQVDEDKCVNCGLCSKVCASLELPRNLNSSNPISYAFISSDLNTVMDSSSGGAFTALAKMIIKQEGIVVGAAWDNDFKVKHILIDKYSDIEKLRKSKYFQSYMGDTFKKIKSVLKNGKKVLFCGTPCQVAGLKKYLKRNYNNLLLIDLLCANCPSAGIFKKYLEENFTLTELKKYDFRYKSSDDKLWNAKKIKISMQDGRTIIKTIEQDDYLQVYHTCSLALASQCLTCKYQGNTRVGDLTIGDCWGIENYDKSIDVSKGVSVILVNNGKGEEFLNSVSREEIGLLKEEPLEQIKKYNVLAFIEKRNWPRTQRREKFLQEIKKGSFADAKDKSIFLPNEELKKDDKHKLVNVMPSKVQNFKAEKKSTNSIELSWSQNNIVEGYIIEQYVGEKWIRIARLAKKNQIRYLVENLQPNETYEFRIKTFTFDEYTSLPLYSDYVTLSETIS